MIYALWITMNSDIYMARKIIKKSMEQLKSQVPGCQEDDLFDIRLILHELIVNAIVHGNEKDMNKQIFLQMNIPHSKNKIELTIKDEGKGFDHTEMKDTPLYPHRSADKTVGKGLMLVSALADRMEILPEGFGVRVTKTIEITEKN